MKKTLKLFLFLLSMVLLILLVSNNTFTSYLLGEVQYQKVQLKPGNIEVPHERTIIWKNQSAFADSIYNFWARRTISEEMLAGKGNAPRILLAKLLIGREIAEVNKTILKLKAWGVSGSSWALNKKGDYDFTFTILTTILWLYGDQPELLYPETKEYLLKVLLTEDGNKFRYTAPRTLRLVKETENHLLMTEGSRYLKNRWIMLHGNKDSYFNNIQNGMETKIMALLEELKTNGLYEFNSLPYIGYTITALLNLEAFASDNVRAEARNVLDYINWCYAIGSYKLKHYPPMRRRYEKSVIQDFDNNYHTVFMKSWLSFVPYGNYSDRVGVGKEHAIMGACLPYRPADKVVRLLFDKRDGYFVRMGHGPTSSPEIYFAGKHFLLSAGGVNRGKRSLIVARPITLFLDDNAENLSETFHLSGPGTNFMEWNNTGVYKKFACAAGPVFIPKSFVPIRKNENWSIYSTNDSVQIAVHSTAGFGLIAIFENTDSDSLLSQLTLSNREIDKLKTCFQLPDGHKITYNVLASKDKWVIISDNEQMLNRDFDNWPLIDGDIKNVTQR